MSKFFPETLSALVDGEVDELELRRLLAALDQADEHEAERLLVQWSRFNTISDVLTSHAVHKASRSKTSDFGSDSGSEALRPVFAEDGFAKIVSDAVAKEIDASATKTAFSSGTSVSHWRGLAVAASVAFAVVLGVQEFDRFAPQGGQPLLASGEQTSTPSVVQQADFVALRSLESKPPADQWVSPVKANSATDQIKAAEAQARLNAYFLQHANRAATQSGHGLIPFARVANFEDQ